MSEMLDNDDSERNPDRIDGLVPTNDPDTVSNISGEQLQRLLSVEERRLELRTRELDLADADIKQGHEYAMAALEAQKSDREQRTKADLKITRWRIFLFGGISILVTGVIVLLVCFNKDATLMELIKFVGYTALGAFGGAGYTKTRPASKQDDEQE